MATLFVGAVTEYEDQTAPGTGPGAVVGFVALWVGRRQALVGCTTTMGNSA